MGKEKMAGSWRGLPMFPPQGLSTTQTDQLQELTFTSSAAEFGKVMKIKLTNRKNLACGFFFLFFLPSRIVPAGKFTFGIAGTAIKALAPFGFFDDNFPFFASRARHPDLFNVGTGVFALREAGTGVELAVAAEL